MPRVRDRADDGDVELTGDEEIVQLRGRARDDLRRHTLDAPVDGAVDRIAVDVGNPTESHSAPSTALARTGSCRFPFPCTVPRCSMWNVGPSGPAFGTARRPGTQSSNVRTVW